MNPLILLMGLLVLAYMGSLLSSDRRIRGLGLPSGAEYVGLGFVLGPNAFGWLDRSMLETFDPIAQVALGWIALVLGLSFGVSLRQTPARSVRNLGLASLASLGTVAAIAGAIAFALTRWSALRGDDRLLFAVGAAAACAETTRESVRWVTERCRASGPLSSAVKALAQNDDLVPLLVLSLCFSVGVSAHVPWRTGVAFWAASTVGLGIVFGGVTTLMIGRELDADETWGTLGGFSVLGTGIMARLGLSAMTALFVMGLSLAVFSSHRRALLAMVEPTERTMLHPLLLLAGARIVLHVPGVPLGLIVGVMLLTRTLAKAATGGVWQATSSEARTAGPLLGLGLLSAGTLSMMVGLACALRFPGPIGDGILVTAAASTAFGEIVGPYALRASLRAAGEIREPAAPAENERAPA